MPRVVASIEARMGSSRLPGKVLADIQGRPALTRLVGRLRRAGRLDGIIVATTVSPRDDALEEWARGEGVEVHRGSEDDVLKRVVEAHSRMNSDIIVEVTGDCTLLDPELIDLGVETYLAHDCDVVTNLNPQTFPMGMDIQVFPFEKLKKVESTVQDPAVREHVSLYFYEHPEIFRILNLFAPARWRAPEYRFQLDYSEDLRFIREIYGRLEPMHGERFGIEEIFSLLRLEPALVEINIRCEEKSAR